MISFCRAMCWLYVFLAAMSFLIGDRSYALFYAVVASGFAVACLIVRRRSRALPPSPTARLSWARVKELESDIYGEIFHRDGGSLREDHIEVVIAAGWRDPRVFPPGAADGLLRRELCTRHGGQARPDFGCQRCVEDAVSKVRVKIPKVPPGHGRTIRREYLEASRPSTPWPPRSSSPGTPEAVRAWAEEEIRRVAGMPPVVAEPPPPPCPPPFPYV